jgi:general secretion pathway protein D
MMPKVPSVRVWSVAGLALFLAACAKPAPEPVAPVRVPPGMSTSGISPALANAAARAAAPDPETDKSRIFRGSGVVVKGQQPGGAMPPGPVQVQPAAGGGVVLNFEGADLREVVRNILGDILNENYTIDSTVGGTVTIRTSAGIPREALPATLELLLRANGATMVKNGGLYQVVPQAQAMRGNTVPQLGTSSRALPPGFSVQIVPLRYVGVREMLRLLEPFARDAQALRFDEVRNLMILSGTERELKNLLDAIAMFDIDWMAGMSAGVFTLQSTDVKSVMTELDKILGDKNLNPLGGILRIVPLERMNALLVITPQPAYLDEAKKWIERLDKGGDAGGGVQFYVFQLQNQRAERLGPLLQQAFTGRVTQTIAPSTPTLSPGTQPGTIVNPPSFQQQSPLPTPAGVVAAGVVAGAVGAAAGANATARALGNEGIGVVRNLQLVADKDNNTILIVATPSEYVVIEQALKKLDIQSRQVVIEVTIAEVSLTDDLQFGVEWLFKGGAPSGRGTGGLFNKTTPFNPGPNPLPTNAAETATLALAKGFTYIINNTNFLGGVQAALNLLDTYGTTKVIANPHIAALDNQKATIKVGTKIPINQQSTVGGVNNVITTTSQYIDTGVLLQVTPHINAGGLVQLDVQAEVSNPAVPVTSGDAPAINTRSVQTFIAVQSGQTMVMGGLIQDSKQNSSEGLPLISRIPILGGLFGAQELKNDRTELVLFITPRVVETEADIRSIVDDLRKKMENMDQLFPAVKWTAQPLPIVIPPMAPILSPAPDAPMPNN